jgi:hypothetical protein
MLHVKILVTIIMNCELGRSVKITEINIFTEMSQNFPKVGPTEANKKSVKINKSEIIFDPSINMLNRTVGPM